MFKSSKLYQMMFQNCTIWIVGFITFWDVMLWLISFVLAVVPKMGSNEVLSAEWRHKPGENSMFCIKTQLYNWIYH